jgi:hypothetical protein
MKPINGVSMINKNECAEKMHQKSSFLYASLQDVAVRDGKFQFHDYTWLHKLMLWKLRKEEKG